MHAVRTNFCFAVLLAKHAKKTQKGLLTSTEGIQPQPQRSRLKPHCAGIGLKRYPVQISICQHAVTNGVDMTVARTCPDAVIQQALTDFILFTNSASRTAKPSRVAARIT